MSPNGRVVTGSLVSRSAVERSQSEPSWVRMEGPSYSIRLVSDSRRIRGKLEVENLGNETLVGGGSHHFGCIAYVQVGLREKPRKIKIGEID